MQDRLTEFPLINAVIEKKQEGRIYTLPAGEFIIHKAGFSKLLGSVEPSIFIEFILNEKTLPQYFHIYDAPNPIIRGIQNNNRFGTKLRKRVQLRYLDNNPPPFAYKTNALVTFSLITQENFDALQVFNLDLDNKFWKAKEDFLQHGYGTVAWKNDSPASICYTSCVDRTIAEVDITTLSSYRGMGLAKGVAFFFLTESNIRGNTTNWDCFEENIASLKSALSLGFKKIKEYRFLSVFINEMD